ncbi:hypothetical protein CFOL_v3_05029 [Cephalotus follicularis]|uniref:Uncharacterized protein n=1 Tax=Cephalotus follicularis TaxID=3775 RepID=A0A1Q3B133_CEPFO|nr:hypothetical protein CFOL_v3_05029 [Cephalotus follicularis]
MDAGGFEFDTHEDDESTNELPNLNAKKFYNLLKDADEPLWIGCKKHTKLSMMTGFLNVKSKYKIPNEGAEDILQIIKSGMPEDEKLPELKHIMKTLGLGYTKIDACVMIVCCIMGSISMLQSVQHVIIQRERNRYLTRFCVTF